MTLARRPARRCRKCYAVLATHVGGVCPVRLPPKRVVPRATQSFRDDELELLSQVMHGLLRRADLSTLGKHPLMPNLLDKIQVMRRRIELLRATEKVREPCENS